jgi:hypothetical protein
MPLSIEGRSMISTTEAITRSGLSQTYICLSIRKGKIRGTKIGNYWFVDEESFEQFLASPRKPGPKPKTSESDSKNTIA